MPEYLNWYREKTLLYISNSSRHPTDFPKGYQGDISTAEYAFDALSRLHHISIEDEDAYPVAVEGWTSVRNIRASALHTVGQSSRLSLRHPILPIYNVQERVDAQRVQRPQVWGSQHGWGR